MAAKRKFEDVEDLETVEEPVSNIAIHAKITSLSPIKRAKGLGEGRKEEEKVF